FNKNRKKKDMFLTTYNFLGIISGIIGLLIKVILWFFAITFTSAAFRLLISPLKYDLDYYKPFFISHTSTVISISVWLFIALAIIHRAGIGGNGLGQKIS